MKTISFNLPIKFVILLAIFFSGAVGLAQTRPDLILVHGANFSLNSWMMLQNRLAVRKFSSTAPQLYGSTEKMDLATAANRLCKVISKYQAPVVLVGHSQGGAVITQAAAQCPQSVRALVYVAAVIPLPGEGVFDDLSAVDNDNYARCGELDETAGVYRLKDFASCQAVFFPDAPPSQAPTDFAMMEPEPRGIGDSHADYDLNVLARLPKYYITTTEDLIISKVTQTKIVGKMKFDGVLSITSSHTPFYSDRDELANLIVSTVRE